MVNDNLLLRTLEKGAHLWLLHKAYRKQRDKGRGKFLQLLGLVKLSQVMVPVRGFNVLQDGVKRMILVAEAALRRDVSC